MARTLNDRPDVPTASGALDTLRVVGLAGISYVAFQAYSYVIADPVPLAASPRLALILLVCQGLLAACVAAAILAPATAFLFGSVAAPWASLAALLPILWMRGLPDLELRWLTVLLDGLEIVAVVAAVVWATRRLSRNDSRRTVAPPAQPE